MEDPFLLSSTASRVYGVPENKADDYGTVLLSPPFVREARDLLEEAP